MKSCFLEQAKASAVHDLVPSSVVIPNAEGGGISLAITAALFFAHEPLIWAR